MKKSIILYALSTAMSKGSILLFFPFLSMLFSLEDFGKWSLIIIISNLLIPIMTLNGSSSILREGSVDIEKGRYLLKYFILYSVTIAALFYFILSVFTIDKWIYYSIIIASLEGVLLLVLTYMRVLDKASYYFAINFFKTLLLFILIVYAKENHFSLFELLFYYTVLLSVYLLFLIVLVILFDKNRSTKILILPALIFAITLIPHGMSQWIMSSSDRFILEYSLGSESVGIYSLAYNLALVLMLLNSGIALALPPYMLKNYNIWKEKGYDNKLIKYYSYLSIFIFILILSIYKVDLIYFRVIGYYGDEMIPLIAIIYLSIYILGLYYFYANYLFYHKKAIIISRTTLYAAIVNVVFTIIFVNIFGILGAAIATLIAYIYYLYTIRKEAIKVEKDLDILLEKPMIISMLSILLISIGFYYAR